MPAVPSPRPRPGDDCSRGRVRLTGPTPASRRLFAREELAYLGESRVARVATVDPDGRPHGVPICFALAGDYVVSAIDEKPQGGEPSRVRRIRNVRTNPPRCTRRRSLRRGLDGWAGCRSGDQRRCSTRTIRATRKPSTRSVRSTISTRGTTWRHDRRFASPPKLSRRGDASRPTTIETDGNEWWGSTAAIPNEPEREGFITTDRLLCDACLSPRPSDPTWVR